MTRVELGPDFFREVGNIEDRITRVERAMKLAAAPINVQVVAGTAEVTSAPAQSSGTLTLSRDLARTLPLQIVYTPPIDAWWDVTFHAGYLLNTTWTAANWGNCQPAVEISPVPPVGGNQASALINGHYASRQLRRVFPLTRGVTYTAMGRLSVYGGSWTYWHGINHLFVQGIAYPRT